MDPLHEPTATEPNPNPTGASERDAKGRFQKGNRGGPGNPFARQTAKLRQAALNAVSEEDIQEVIAILKAKAKEGDVAAIKLLLSYSVGKPATAADPDTLDQHEMHTIINNHASSLQSVMDVVQAMPVDALLIMLRAMLPALFDRKLQMAKEVLSQPPATEEDEEDEEEEAEKNKTVSEPDMIPDWMKAIVDPNRPEPKIVFQPESVPDRQGGKRSAEKRGAKRVSPGAADVKPAMNPVTPQPESAKQSTNGASIDGEVLRILLQRMSGLLEPADGRSGPIANGSNGT